MGPFRAIGTADDAVLPRYWASNGRINAADGDKFLGKRGAC